uniref:LD10456p (inferred by orthology to a D. melanogaster protein) n=1 Tax=Anisakis simplex TaxID=6269 RepID=A0A0M3KEY8_ANISI
LPVYVIQQKHLPFEPFFPFDSYYLCRSSVFIKPLLRRFTPLAEDASVLQRELRWHNAKTLSGAMGFKNTDEAAGSLDFLEDLRRDMTDLVPSGRQSIDEIADIFMRLIPCICAETPSSKLVSKIYHPDLKPLRFGNRLFRL